MYKQVLLIVTGVIVMFSSPSIAQQKCLSMHVILNTSAGYFNDAGKPAGFHLDYIEALAKQSGLCIDTKLLPYSRARRGIVIGDHDGGILARAESLDASVEYIANLITSRTVIIPRKGLALHSYQDLSTITIAKVRGADLNELLDNDTNLTFVAVADYKRGLELLKMGRVDAIAGNQLGLSAIGLDNMASDLNLAGQMVIGQREVWLVFSKKSANRDKITQLKSAAQVLNKQGILNSILVQYFGTNWQLTAQ